MRIGPFRTYEIDNIKEFLESKGIEFGIFVDKALEKEILETELTLRYFF